MNTFAKHDWSRAIRLFTFSLLATLLYWWAIFFFIVPSFSAEFLERLLLCALVVLCGVSALFALRPASLLELVAVAAGLGGGSALWWCVIMSLQNWHITVVYPWLSAFSPVVLLAGALPFWWLARWRLRRAHGG